MMVARCRKLKHIYVKSTPNSNAKGGSILQQDNRGPGAARNNGAKHAKGEFIMFMDDDNFAKPKEIATFVSVAMHTKADVLTCTNEYFYGLEFPGNRSILDDGDWFVLLLKEHVSKISMETQTPDSTKVLSSIWVVSRRITAMLLKIGSCSQICLGGYKLESIFSPLYWYRIRDTSHSHETAKYGNAARTIRPYLRQIPQKLHHIVLFAQGMKDSHDVAAGQLEEQNGQMRTLVKC